MPTISSNPDTTPDAPLLDVRDIVVGFGGIVALDSVSFDVPAGAIVGLIGPNGAGKTTLFNCLSRLYTPRSGSICFAGRSILEGPAHRIAGLGIGRTFQNLALFQGLSVVDNVRIGGHTQSAGNLWVDALGLPSARRNSAASAAAAHRFIDYLGLADVACQRVGDLPFGTQKRVELARALATRPRLLLLDEPACGLNHEEVEQLGATICRIQQDFGLAILLVEHHMGLVMSISHKVVALNFGRKIAEGTPQHVQAHPDVIAAYLGAEVE
jgi:branched-chain amino acid transport system ATP-binding protein